jgi:hypothetical protein
MARPPWAETGIHEPDSRDVGALSAQSVVDSHQDDAKRALLRTQFIPLVSDDGEP